MVHPDAERFFAKKMPAGAIKKLPTHMKNVHFYPSAEGKVNFNYGKDKVCLDSKAIGKLVGCEEWLKMTNHANRPALITMMNIKKVPLGERLKRSHHRSANSQIPYDRPGAESRCWLDTELANRQRKKCGC
jgi:hypothetical protein